MTQLFPTYSREQADAKFFDKAQAETSFYTKPQADAKFATKSEQRGELRHDNDGVFDYTGQAPTGTPESSTGWTVTRITFSVSPVLVEIGTGSWTSRASLDYSEE